MNATGLIVEYNPFHNGHKFHIEKTKEKFPEDVIIAVMSGNFTQRGDVAILDKWDRTEIILEHGIDLVIELPVYYSTQSAEIFAYGSTKILDILDVRNLVFGSESGNIDSLLKFCNNWIENESEINLEIKKIVKTGISYTNAIVKVAENVAKNLNLNITPNNILGIEYIKSIIKNNFNINAETIKREKVEYYDEKIIGKYASATAIRNSVHNGTYSNYKKCLPFETKQKFIGNININNIFKYSSFWEMLKLTILKENSKILNIQDVEIGFENRLLKFAKTSNGYEEFFDKITTCRYTLSRTQRILTHTLLGITKELTNIAKKETPYIKILGANAKGRKYLNEIKKKLENVTIITNIKKEYHDFSENAYKLLEIDLLADNIYYIKNKKNNRKIPIIK